jgi:hypothetical protein
VVLDICRHVFGQCTHDAAAAYTAAAAAAAAAADCPSPEEVVLDICRHVQAMQSLPSRHLMRLIPVSHTCGISRDEITAMAAKVAEKFFPTGAADALLLTASSNGYCCMMHVSMLMAALAAIL